MGKMELLAPAGSMDKMKMAFLYGADAVYLGGKSFGLRAFSDNFSNEELKEAVDYAHARGKHVHVTVNIFPHNDDLKGLPEYLVYLRDIGVDAILIADPGIFALARQLVPDLPVHISTQANTTNWASTKFWRDNGASRVVMAREVSLRDVKEIHAKVPDIELEGFIHGAMCISYSGRCLLSNYFVGRDANQGACTHPCRWKYSVVEETRPGEYMPVYENERGTYIFNSKDLCMIEHIPEMIDAGIDSFKIEGRMKTALYVATVARTYRKAIDDYLKSPELYRENMEWYKSEIGKCTYREFTTGFYFHKPDAMTQIYDSNTYVKNYTYLGTVEAVREDGLVRIEQKNKFSVGETVEIMKPDGRNLEKEVAAICDEEGNPVESAPHPKQVLYVDLGADAECGDIIRRSEMEAD